MSTRDEQDQRAFEQLYRATRSDVLAFLLRRCRDNEEAADMLAQAYLIAWQKLDTTTSGDAARLWLFGVARNLLLEGARRRRAADALVDRLVGEVRVSLTLFRGVTPVDPACA